MMSWPFCRFERMYMIAQLMYTCDETAYGGRAGYDLEAIARGLEDVVEDAAARLSQHGGHGERARGTGKCRIHE